MVNAASQWKAAVEWDADDRLWEVYFPSDYYLGEIRGRFSSWREAMDEADRVVGFHRAEVTS